MDKVNPNTERRLSHAYTESKKKKSNKKKAREKKTIISSTATRVHAFLFLSFPFSRVRSFVGKKTKEKKEQRKQSAGQT